MRPRFSLRTLLVLVALCAVGVAVPYWIPKSQPLSMEGVGYYRGLGRTNGRGYFGKNWYRIVVQEDGIGYWEVDVNGFGFNPYRGYYDSGVLSEEGMCMVFENGDDIAADRHDLLHGKFYDPRGKLISEVENGTGKQVLFLPDGTRHWELDLANGKRAQVKIWYPSGQLAAEEKYSNGKLHGDHVSYHASGKLKSRGQYTNGKQTGVWRRYLEDGTLKSESNYDAKAE